MFIEIILKDIVKNSLSTEIFVLYDEAMVPSLMMANSSEFVSSKFKIDKASHVNLNKLKI